MPKLPAALRLAGTIVLAESGLRELRPGATGAATMLLLPSAGGGPYSMSALVGQLPAEVRVLAASYPGRSGHPDDPPAERLDDIADGLAKAIGAPPAGGLAVFGHSLGAMIGLRLSRLIEQAGHRLLAFAPAGCPPPHRAPNDLHVLSTKDDSVLVSDLIRLGGLPPDLREDADILASVLAVIRGDFALTVDYPEPVIASRLSCPIVALGGEDDPATAPPVLPFWSEATEGGARVRVVPGGHFFHLEHPAEVTSAIAPYLHAPATAADSRLDPIAARR